MSLVLTRRNNTSGIIFLLPSLYRTSNSKRYRYYDALTSLKFSLTIDTLFKDNYLAILIVVE